MVTANRVLVVWEVVLAAAGIQQVSVVLAVVLGTQVEMRVEVLVEVLADQAEDQVGAVVDLATLDIARGEALVEVTLARVMVAMVVAEMNQVVTLAILVSIVHHQV